MQFAEFLRLWKHPIIHLVTCMSVLVALPMCWNFVSQNFVQIEIEDFIRQNHAERYNSTLSDHTTKQMTGLFTAIPFFFALVVAPIAKSCADRWGRRSLLFTGAGLFAVACGSCYLLARLLGVYELLFLGRLFWGGSWSFTMITFPIYISEISPPKIRGAAAAMGTFAVAAQSAFFIFLVSFVGLPQLLGRSSTWHIYLFLPAIGGLIAALSTRCFPETPKYLLLHSNDRVAAKKIMNRYYQGYDDKEIEEALTQFQVESEQAKKGISLRDMTRDPILRLILIITNLIAVSRLACGGMLIRIYATSIAVEQLGMTPEVAKYIMIGVAFLSFCSGLLGVWLIERTGRRMVYFVNIAAMLLCAIVFFLISAVNYYSPDVVGQGAFLLGYVLLMFLTIFFQAGPDIVTIFYVAELTPQHARAATTTLSSSVGIVIRMLYFYAFPPLQKQIGPWSIFLLVIFPTIMLNGYLFFNMPETRGHHVSDILLEWRAKLGLQTEKKDYVNGHSITVNDDSTVVEKTSVC